MAQGPSRSTQWDLNPQPLNTCVSGGAGSTTELSPTPIVSEVVYTQLPCWFTSAVSYGCSPCICTIIIFLFAVSHQAAVH